MSVVTYEPATDIVIPNITVERKFYDGVQTAYRLTPYEGYVLHDPNDDATIEDPDTGDIVVERYYYRQAVVNVRVPVENWTWEAVLESEVPADMIFGGGDNSDHEIM